MDTLARICETLDCGIMDVIELASDEPSTHRRGTTMEKLKERITENGIDYILVGDYYIPDLKLPEGEPPHRTLWAAAQEYLKQEHPARYSKMPLHGKIPSNGISLSPLHPAQRGILICRSFLHNILQNRALLLRQLLIPDL